MERYGPPVGARRLRIERFQLTRPAGEPEEDDALFLVLQFTCEERMGEQVEAGHVGEESRAGGSRSGADEATA